MTHQRRCKYCGTPLQRSALAGWYCPGPRVRKRKMLSRPRRKVSGGLPTLGKKR